MTWLFFALLAPFLYAIVNLVDDNLLKNVHKSPHSGAVVAGIFGGLPLISLFVYDLKSVSLAVLMSAILAGFFLSVFYFGYFSAFEKESPSVVIALIGTAPVFLAIFGYIFLGERLTKTQLIGGAVVLVASIIMAIKREGKIKISKSIGYVFISLICTSLYSGFAKYSFDRSDFYTVYMYISLGMLLGGLYFIYFLVISKKAKTLKRLRKNIKKYFFVFLAAELLALAAEFTMNKAISMGSVTLTRAIEGIQPAFVLLIAVLLSPLNKNMFREASEGGKLKKLLCIIAMAFGIYLILRNA